jgi:hypothetical protein
MGRSDQGCRFAGALMLAFGASACTQDVRTAPRAALPVRSLFDPAADAPSQNRLLAQLAKAAGRANGGHLLRSRSAKVRQQRAGFHEITRYQAFVKPGTNWRENFSRLLSPATRRLEPRPRNT